jgi:soluble lytic murein transglycosylase-like protein
VLLPRRTQTGPAHLKCRNKGKAVIVRIGNIHLGLRAISSPLALWGRKLVSVLALVASLAALALIVDDQYGDFLFGPYHRGGPIAEAAADSSDQPQAVALTPAEERRYSALSEFVANRYRVSQTVAFDLVELAHRVGKELQLDPLLIIAVISIESRFNPIAESVAGAKGLMQIIPKYHTEKLQVYGGVDSVFDPETNIQVGARILKEYIRVTGNIGIALQMYAGALSDQEDQYTNKVMNEKQRLQQVLSRSVRRAPAPTAPAAPMRTAAVRTDLGYASPLD